MLGTQSGEEIVPPLHAIGGVSRCSGPAWCPAGQRVAYLFPGQAAAGSAGRGEDPGRLVGLVCGRPADDRLRFRYFQSWEFLHWFV